MAVSFLSHVTPDDIVRGGACADGVYAVMRELNITATCIAVPALLRALGDNVRRREYVERAAGLVGSGYGSGGGSGDGYGEGGGGSGGGSGYGYGYGEGDGSGDGYGDGDGSGYG